MKYILLCTCILAGIGTHAQQATEQSAPEAHGPQIKYLFHDNVCDFYRVPLNSTVEYKLQFTNSGDEPLVITEMHAAADVQQPACKIDIKWPAKPIKPGKKGLITVTYSSKGEIGSFKGDIYITCNAGKADYPLIHMMGAVVPGGAADLPPMHNPNQEKHGTSQEAAVFEVLANSAIYVIEHAGDNSK